MKDMLVTRRGQMTAALSAMSGAVLAACAPRQDSGAPNPAPVTQGVVIRFGSKDTAPASLARLEQLAKENFATEFPGARVEIEPLTGGYFEKLQAHLAAGTEPDTTRIDEYYIPFLVSRDALRPMDPYASSDKQFDPKGLFPTPYKAGQYRGKFYGLTTSPNTYVLLFNRTAFEEAGLKPPPADYRDKTWTWNRMREDARRLTRPGATPPETRFGFQWDVALLSRLSSQIRANGGKLADRDEDPRKGAFDDPKTLDLLQLYQEMRHRDRSIPAEDDLKTSPAPSVANGRLAMQVSLANVGGAALANAPFRWDIAPLPRANSTGQASTTLITNVYSMFKSTRHPELAWGWVRLAGGEKHALFQVQQLNFMPGWKSLREEYLKVTPPEHRQAALDTADYGLPSISSPRYVEMQDIINQGLAPVWAGTSPVKQAVDQMLPKLNDLLRQAGQ
jgi:multiple sugar transport system substrate-binding protein